MTIESQMNSITNWLDLHPFLSGAILLWSLIWKGLALWRSAELRQKYWFVAVLILNTVGLLDIFYILFIARKYKVEVIEN
jgi:hypothetical protein